MISNLSTECGICRKKQDEYMHIFFKYKINKKFNINICDIKYMISHYNAQINRTTL